MTASKWCAVRKAHFTGRAHLPGSSRSLPNKAKDSPFFAENGKLIIYARNGRELSKVAEAPVGKWCQGIAWSANSKTLLVQCMVDNAIHVVAFSGISAKSLTRTGIITTTGGPAGIRTAE